MTVISVRVNSAPSLAVARSTYVPGAVKCAVVTALPSATAIGPEGSNTTLAGPRYSSHVTVSPLGREPVDILTCPVGALPERGFGGDRGFGSPSSVTITVNASGLFTLAAAMGASVIVSPGVVCNLIELTSWWWASTPNL